MTWIIKKYITESFSSTKGKYCYLANQSENTNFDFAIWADQKENASLFLNKFKALEVLYKIKGKGIDCKLFHLKSKKKLFRPEQDTVFIDYSMPTPTPHIVASIYEDRGDFENKFKITEFVCAYNSYVVNSDDIWGTLEEFNQYLEAGKIKIIWEPNKKI